MRFLRNLVHNRAQRAAALAAALAAFDHDTAITIVAADGIAVALYGAIDTPPHIVEGQTEHTDAPQLSGGIQFMLNASPDAVTDDGAFDEWMLAFSSAFRKATSTIDRKLQGRILQAINELSRDPMKGYSRDTCKNRK